VTWMNADDDAHDIVADDKSFRPLPMDTFSFTFSRAGTYAYHRGLHPHMVGKIVVTP
jgi:plastocyanin